jgi:hypothetical protein
MRYVLLIYQNEAEHAQLSQEERGAENGAYKALTEEFQHRGDSADPHGDNCAGAWGQNRHYGWPFCRDERASARLCAAELSGPR